MIKTCGSMSYPEVIEKLTISLSNTMWRLVIFRQVLVSLALGHFG